MKKKNIILISGLIISLIIIFCIIYPSVLWTPPLSRGGMDAKKDLSPTLPLIRGGEDTNTENTNLPQPSLVKVEVNMGKESQIEVKPLSENVKNIQVILNVLDKTHTVNIKDGATVYDTMNNVQSLKENNFSFHSKEYPSLGSFITEINGIKGTPGKYWIYYVNNIEASVGVSKYILKDGDSILWKQE